MALGLLAGNGLGEEVGQEAGQSALPRLTVVSGST